MDTQKIDYFMAVVQHGNISSAAEALRISQPTLSRQIHALEREFSTPLFVRHGRGVVTTEAGKRLHDGLRRLDQDLRSLRDQVVAAAQEPSGQVAIGIPPSPRTLLGVALVGAFADAHPQVTLRVAEETSGTIRDLLARGELDLAIVNSGEPVQGLATHGLAAEPMLLVGPADSGLALDVPTAVATLAEVPLILTTHPNSLRRMVELRLQQEGLRPIVRIEANTLPLMTDLVARGLGYTVLPSCSVLRAVQAGHVAASPLDGMRITWTVARPLNRPLRVSASRLLETVFSTVHALVADGTWPLAELEPDCRAFVRRKIRPQ